MNTHENLGQSGDFGSAALEGDEHSAALKGRAANGHDDLKAAESAFAVAGMDPLIIVEPQGDIPNVRRLVQLRIPASRAGNQSPGIPCQGSPPAADQGFGKALRSLGSDPHLVPEVVHLRDILGKIANFDDAAHAV